MARDGHEEEKEPVGSFLWWCGHISKQVEVNDQNKLSLLCFNETCSLLPKWPLQQKSIHTIVFCKFQDENCGIGTILSTWINSEQIDGNGKDYKWRRSMLNSSDSTNWNKKWLEEVDLVWDSLEILISIL